MLKQTKISGLKVKVKKGTAMKGRFPYLLKGVLYKREAKNFGGNQKLRHFWNFTIYLHFEIFIQLIDFHLISKSAGLNIV